MEEAMEQFDIIIRQGTLINEGIRRTADIGIKDHKIVAIEDNLSADAKREVDANGSWVLPGIIDSQVHFREPGLTHKEDLESGSMAAALGGVTTFLEMPNTNPPTTTDLAIAEKVSLGKNRCYTNFGFFMGATAENLEELKKVGELEGCVGIKIFLGSSTGDLLLYEPEKLLDILTQTKVPIAVHSESETVLKNNIAIRDNAKSVHAHYHWRSVESAVESTKAILELCKKANRKVHVLHVTTGEEMKILKENKDYCTVEVTPQHITLHAPDIYDQIGTYAQMNPPIRELPHKDQLWEGVLDGTVDVIGSDHAPHTKEEKDKGYPKSPSGMPGVQTILPIMLNWVSAGKLSAERLVELLCHRPATLYKLSGRGFLAEGNFADITIVDPNKTYEMKDEDMASKCGWTPFNGMQMQGQPTMTIVNGKVVMENGKLTEDRAGAPVKYQG
jgi:dihydroorotase